MQKTWIEPPEGWQPEIRFPDDHPKWPGTPRCLQWIYKKGRQCTRPPMKGKSKEPHPAGPGWKRKCHTHGGKAVSGIAHPQYKRGRYGMNLGEEKAKALDKLLSDEDILKLDDNIALLDMRIIELVDSLMEGGNPAQLWKKALKSWEFMWMATAREDSDAVAKHRNDLDEILRKGAKDIFTWEEIDDRTETRRRLVDTEMRRREKMQYLVMVEDALKDYMAIGRTIRLAIAEADIPDNVKQSILNVIQDGFSRHMQIGAPGGADADA